MSGDEKGYRFEPRELTIRSGDAVTWTVVSGGPHDVRFWPDSIPAGAEATLQSHLPGSVGRLAAPMTFSDGETFTASFAGVPPGVYRYYCNPHLAQGMLGRITVN